jgi:predicted PurR-regulated permease PerM
MKTKDKIISIALILGAFFWLIYLISAVLTPFIFSLIIAYFLNPLVNHLHEKYKLSRLTATSLILGLFIAAAGGIIAILLPTIYTQLIALIDALPTYFNSVVNNFYPLIAEHLNRFGFKLQTSFSNLIESQNIAARFVGLSKNIVHNAISSSLSLINILSLIFITPILIFYLLKDWDILVNKINDYLPRGISSSVKKIARDMDATLAGYVRGQFNVCLILSIIYSTLLSLTGLNFGFLIGFLTGIFSFIPYVGMLSGVTAAIIVALFQWGLDFNGLIMVLAVFIFGQFIESNFLTPKLIGARIGLHPVWIVFGLFVFGALFGFTGILFSVPLTAICGVIIKHFAIEYKRRFT